MLSDWSESTRPSTKNMVMYKKHKTRLVVKGYFHQSGVDFNKIFVPIAHIETDVKSTFLNSELEEVYMDRPQGYMIEVK